MNERQPSRTALGAAGYRAAHQQLEGGKVFSDPLARTILGDGADAIIAGLSADPAQQRMRIFMAARSRFAEDCLGAAVSRGVRQAVILGAGFDTFALRNPYSNLGLRVFEVDHPATQAWKRKRLSEVGLAIPASLTFAAIDFESDDLGHGLRDAGFDPDRPAFFIWLGVVPYLGRAAIAATLRYIASVPESEVVFDYSEPLENYPPERRADDRRTRGPTRLKSVNPGSVISIPTRSRRSFADTASGISKTSACPKWPSAIWGRPPAAPTAAPGRI